MQRSSLKIDRGRSTLVITDVQERLLRAMQERQTLLANLLRLLKGCQILNVPAIVVEQYPKGLGPTIPEIASIIGELQPLSKVAFSCCGAPGLVDGLTKTNVTD